VAAVANHVLTRGVPAVEALRALARQAYLMQIKQTEHPRRDRCILCCAEPSSRVIT
jgi:hypothetical protein